MCLLPVSWRSVIVNSIRFFWDKCWSYSLSFTYITWPRESSVSDETCVMLRAFWPSLLISTKCNYFCLNNTDYVHYYKLFFLVPWSRYAACLTLRNSCSFKSSSALFQRSYQPQAHSTLFESCAFADLNLWTFCLRGSHEWCLLWNRSIGAQRLEVFTEDLINTSSSNNGIWSSSLSGIASTVSSTILRHKVTMLCCERASKHVLDWREKFCR